MPGTFLVTGINPSSPFSRCQLPRSGAKAAVSLDTRVPLLLPWVYYLGVTLCSLGFKCHLCVTLAWLSPVLTAQWLQSHSANGLFVDLRYNVLHLSVFPWFAAYSHGRAALAAVQSRALSLSRTQARALGLPSPFPSLQLKALLVYVLCMDLSCPVRVS